MSAPPGAPRWRSRLSGDERILFGQLCRSRAEPCNSAALAREPTQALLPQLRADHEAAAALCRKMGMRSCKELREAKEIRWGGLSAADLALLSTLGSVLPALESLILVDEDTSAGPDGMQRLAEGLGAGALPAVTWVELDHVHVDNAGASALAAALGRGALPRLMTLSLYATAIGDAGLVALAPALRRLPALEQLYFMGDPISHEGLAALVAPPPPASALSPSTGVLTKLELLGLSLTQVSDVGCAALGAVLDGGALLALETLKLYGIPASAAAKAAVYEARDKLQGSESDSESEEEDEE